MPEQTAADQATAQTHAQTPASAHEPGAANAGDSVQAMLAQSSQDPASVAALITAHPAQRNQILTYLQTHAGNAFTQSVVADLDAKRPTEAHRMPLVVGGTAATTETFNTMVELPAGTIFKVTSIDNDQVSGDIVGSGHGSDAMKSSLSAPLKSVVAEPGLADKGDSHADNLLYTEFSGPLWNGVPKLEDVHQGFLGDCYFAAACGAIAHSNPAAIMRLFSDHTPGLKEYTITLFAPDKGGEHMHPVPQIVDTRIASVAGADPTSAYLNNGQAASDHTKPLWPVLLEKAFAQLENGFNQVEADAIPIFGLEAITGKPADMQFGAWKHEPDAALIAKFAAFQRVNKAVTCGCDDNVPDLHLFGEHTYIFDKVQGDKLVFKNPWGEQHPDPITAAQFKAHFTDINVAGM